MRAYDIVMLSGAKAEVIAEAMHDDREISDKIYFYRDAGHKQVVAYFLRNQVAGIIFERNNSSATRR
jgi:hypothetical protein